MSEYMFGCTRRRLTQRESDRRNRICKEEGGTGYTEIREASGDYLGWFTGPNRGEPFDRQLEQRVMGRVNRKA